MPLIINYQIEKYSVQVQYLHDEDVSVNKNHSVCIEFFPNEHSCPRSGLNITYNTNILHLADIEDIFTMIIDGDCVKLEIKDYSRVYKIYIPDKNVLESFVSLVSGYYRLRVKWYVDLCSTLQSPHLKTLNSLKCHGPIGNDCAYSKLKIKELTAGAYIIRQCRGEFDTYFVDIVVRP